jgi:dTMP kinase
MESRDPAFHERVRLGYLAEAGRRPDRVQVVDAGGSPDAVHEEIRTRVGQALGILKSAGRGGSEEAAR